MERKLKAEVAIKLLMDDIARNGLKLLDYVFMRDRIRTHARKIDLKEDVLGSFVEVFYRYMMDRAFTKKSESLDEKFAQVLMLGMDEEVAYKLYKLKMKKEGIHLRENSTRRVGEISEKTGIKPEDLKAFFRIMIHEMADEILKPKK